MPAQQLFGQSTQNSPTDDHNYMVVNDDGSIITRNLPALTGAPVPLGHVNTTYGDDINQNGAIGGSQVLMYDENAGTPTEYNATAISGTWDFESSAITPYSGSVCIDATGTINGSTMELDNGACPTCTALSGYIYLTSWSVPAANSIKVFGWNATTGVMIGNEVNLENYFDIAELNKWQAFVIPLADMGIDGSTSDAYRFRTEATGVPPNYYLDLINLEESGSLTFTTLGQQPPNTLYYADVLKISTLYNGNPYEQDPRDYYSRGALANGLTNIIQSGGIITSAVTFVDILSNGKLGESRWVPNSYDSATGIGWADIYVDFKTPLILNSTLNDYSAIIVNDDLSVSQGILQHHIYLGGKFQFITW